MVTSSLSINKADIAKQTFERVTLFTVEYIAEVLEPSVWSEDRLSRDLSDGEELDSCKSLSFFVEMSG